ncbi:MAG: ABC transporter permease subunit [Akkermansiaceae bacterium]|nr:ABC transporter permease subunit [Akkermansiaceae bacterium]
MRLLGLFSLLLGALAAIGECMGVALPTARWFFTVSREVPFLKMASSGFPWFGWLCTVLLIVGGLWMIVRSFTSGPPNPITARRIKRFCEIKRGYYSLILLLVLGFIAMLDQAIVGKRALAVNYGGKWTFPAFMPKELKNKDFGINGETAEAPADYRKLKRLWKETGEHRVIMPLVPYDPTGDTLPPRSKKLTERDGIYYEGSSRKPYWGLVAKYYDTAEGKMQLRHTMRKGKLTGATDGWDAAGKPVYSADYQNGEPVTERYSGAGEKADFLSQETSDLRAVKYHPAPPIPEEGNWLGTTSQGYDVLSYLYGGLQVNFKAALIYLPIVYFIGITLGMMMGYFGGWFDLISQRLIEIFSNVPFLFIVIIFSSMVPEKFKGLPIILTILIVFGWMGMTYLMRTAAYRDKERDYIAAAKVLGASTPRILFRHLLPNTISIIVTLVPFTMSGLIFSLTSLDYLGFGLPPEYATWGRLLNDGLSNLSAPWLVTSTFIVLVGLLVLITFIGEAVREAFDPKKFTYYR